MRGEHLKSAAAEARRFGSSPHARGTPRGATFRGVRVRFIPACAGNTSDLRSRREAAAVHPRMRGEHNPLRLISSATSGSSPHARGTRDRARVPRAPARFIPACAGNTPGQIALRRTNPVHPRMRGEHRGAASRGSLPAGSSPHARGTHDAAEVVALSIRFIPACAGNTSA